jgi:hypothetical protein
MERMFSLTAVIIDKSRNVSGKNIVDKIIFQKQHVRQGVQI